MKINSIPGDFGFKALYSHNNMWVLTQAYFLTKEEAEKHFLDHNIKFVWPVEEHPETGAVYIPSPEELQ